MKGEEKLVVIIKKGGSGKEKDFVICWGSSVVLLVQENAITEKTFWGKTGGK